MSLTTRSYQKELMDADSIPFADILAALQELNKINTWLGGHKITCRGINHFIGRLPRGGQVSIAEIGCGGGDNLVAIRGRLEQKKHTYHLTGIDIKEECIQYARTQCTHGIEWLCSDYSKVEWPAGKPDIIFSSLFCHHFTDEQMVAQLLWLRANSRMGFFINDLHRHPLAYHSIKLLTSLFSGSYLVKNDAPLSVARGFRRKDWQALLDAAGINDYSINWQWAFRYLICVSNEQR